MIASFRIGRYTCGIFPYWIGVSRRDLKTLQVIDLGFFKIMWSTPRHGRLQPCGHPETVVAADEGTKHCSECAKEVK